MAENTNGSDSAIVIPRLNSTKKPKRKRLRTKAVKARKPVSLEYSASIHFSSPNPSDTGVPQEFAVLVSQLEKQLGMPVWLLVQNGKGKCSEIDVDTFKGFQRLKNEIPEARPAALLLESPGGSPSQAYYISRYFQRRCSRFLTVVPQYAKSAATLIALSGTQIMMGRDAEIGPLDVQIFDAERERYGSALNTLQSLERLHADALTCVDGMMQLLLLRTGKKVDAILPTVLRHATEFVQPLVEKIDTLDYTEKSRAMKMAEDYAIRLMTKAGYPKGDPEVLSRRLVTGYADHGFIIDAEEANELEMHPNGRHAIGLRLAKTNSSIEEIFDRMVPFLDSLTVVGRLNPVKP